MKNRSVIHLYKQTYVDTQFERAGLFQVVKETYNCNTVWRKLDWIKFLLPKVKRYPGQGVILDEIIMELNIQSRKNIIFLEDAVRIRGIEDIFPL
jgi:hypothetical protein